MEVNRIVSIFAGAVVMGSLGLAHWQGQIDLAACLASSIKKPKKSTNHNCGMV